MTAPSERDVEREIEKLKERTTETRPEHGAAFETESGGYCDIDGNPIEEWSEVTFVVPYDLWHGEWKQNGFGPTPRE